MVDGGQKDALLRRANIKKTSKRFGSSYPVQLDTEDTKLWYEIFLHFDKLIFKVKSFRVPKTFFYPSTQTIAKFFVLFVKLVSFWGENEPLSTDMQ